jgi:uncharacterized iron-regulated membrane protein
MRGNGTRPRPRRRRRRLAVVVVVVGVLLLLLLLLLLVMMVLDIHSCRYSTNTKMRGERFVDWIHPFENPIDYSFFVHLCVFF